MEVEITYTIKLTAPDARNLKKILGNMNDGEFLKHGVASEGRARLSELWAMLPDVGEE